MSEALCRGEGQGSDLISNLIIFPWNQETVLLDLGNLTVNVPKEKENTSYEQTSSSCDFPERVGR